MKISLILCGIALAIAAFGPLGGCTTATGPNPDVAAIQKSCDDPKSDHTMINGRSYFCMDHDLFYQQLNRLLQQYTRSI